MRLTPILCLCLALGASACSRSDADKLKHDTQAVGHDVASDVRKVGDDPNLKDAGNQLKTAAHETGEDLKKAGEDVGNHVKAAGDDTREAANK